MKQTITPSLEEAKKRISNWRATRTKRRPIPDEVWDAVLPLIGHHSYSTINREFCLEAYCNSNLSSSGIFMKI